ncbi:MAG: hypothetical protein MUC48_13100, partial [Leptolyngbya sp. Prado105]|nr:hypothetical protein [Leptolyngbya sp. Prado105]
MSDLFINEGSASAAENSIISMGQTSVELLQYLIAEMKRRQAEEELRRQEKEQRQEEQSQSELSEEAIAETPEFSADALMADLERKTIAATAVSVLEEFGQGDRYQSEGFTIKTNYENAQQIYTVRDQDFNEVLRFEKLGEEATPQTIAELKREWEENHAKVIAAGGLHIIGSERHESRRIDNQLRGRSGRQGDPGVTRFYLSLEDDLMRVFANDRVKSMMRSLG